MAEATSEQQPVKAAKTAEQSDFEALLKKEFKPRSEDAKVAVENGVKTLAQQALEQTALISDDAAKTIEAMMAQIDEKLSEQINRILHHPDFQQLEGTWRGLHHLVSHTETDDNLKIKVFNISRKELGKLLKKYQRAAWDQNPLFKKIYEEEFGTPGGEPYGCLIGDYYFSHSPPDVAILKGVAQIAAAAHAPFISGVDPILLNMGNWRELGNPSSIAKIFQTAEYAPWNALRGMEDARYLAMAMPRFLARLPYGAETDPVDAFAFEEDTQEEGEESAGTRYTWANAAYAMGVNINRSFKLYGWCSAIRGVENGGIVEGLPCHTFPTDDGGVDMQCPTEVAITDRREKELSDSGFLPLCHWKNTDYSVFIGSQSLHKPPEYSNPDATANAQLGARLPYLFATCRFAHFLKCIVRDKIGSFKEREDMEHFLNEWITQYVTTDPSASEEMKARYPLADAKVLVEEIPGNPGFYNAKFFLRPHFQLEGLSVSLRLVSKLPSVKSGGR